MILVKHVPDHKIICVWNAMTQMLSYHLKAIANANQLFTSNLKTIDANADCSAI